MNTLQRRRTELGLTQPQVSDALKVADPRMDVGMVSRFERGACLPTPKVLEALESILQAPRTALFEADELAAIAEFESDSTQKFAAVEVPPNIRLVVDMIPVGKKNAITREKLARLLGTNDRTARELVRKAREYGYIIINEQDGRGYYRTDDLDMMERQYKQDTRRALSVLSRRKTLRQILKAAGREV